MRTRPTPATRIGSALDPFVEVAPRFESEEVVDGLRSLKIRIDRRYTGHARALQELWLAPERNHHCIKERLSWPDGRFADLPSHETRVEDLRELAPGVWVPTRIVVNDYDDQAPGPDRASAVGRTIMTVEKVALAPRREASFFCDVPIPADLPVFTIKDRQLAGWNPPRPIDGRQGREDLARLVARIAAQERRYDGLEVKARDRRLEIAPDSLEQNSVVDWSSVGRSVHRGDRYFSSYEMVQLLRSGARREMSRTMGFDGQWARLIERNAGPNGRLFLRRGRSTADRLYLESDGPHQPHTLVLRDYPRIPTLAELLDPSGPPPSGPWACRLGDAGTVEVDGHPCLVLAGDLPPTRDGRPGGTLVLYLATDRNDIPIRMELSNAVIAGRYIPSMQVVAGDLRPIAPGLWYPFRITGLGFETGSRMARGWFVLNWRRDTTIDSARLLSEIDNSVFHHVVAPAGAKVEILDEYFRRVGEIQQDEVGVPSITMATYLKLLSQEPVTPREQQARLKVFEALIGHPAPAFPAGAPWLRGEPLSWAELRGRVVILGFWAEWSDDCREDLARLNRLHRDRAGSGLTIVGVHPPGSEPAAIRTAMDALHLEFPTCVDVPAAAGYRAWGELFDRFAVQAIPHAVAVERRGNDHRLRPPQRRPGPGPRVDRGVPMSDHRRARRSHRPRIRTPAGRRGRRRRRRPPSPGR